MTRRVCIAIALMACSICVVAEVESVSRGEESVAAETADETRRYFMFSSRPNADAWKVMIANPEDREAATSAAVARIGGEMLGYYWSVGEARNYIILALPDSETVLAMLIQRLSSGLLVEYEATELLLSSDMPGVFARLEELNAADNSMPEE